MDGTSPSIDVRMCVTRCAWIAWMYMSFVCLLSFSQPVEESRTPVNSFGGVFFFFFYLVSSWAGMAGRVGWSRHGTNTLSFFIFVAAVRCMHQFFFLFGVLILCVTRVLFVVVVRLACVCVCVRAHCALVEWQQRQHREHCETNIPYKLYIHCIR